MGRAPQLIYVKEGGRSGPAIELIPGDIAGRAEMRREVWGMGIRYLAQLRARLACEVTALAQHSTQILHAATAFTAENAERIGFWRSSSS